MGEDERRRAPRIPAKVPVKLRPVEGTTPYMVSADSINISERGLYFQMTGPMKIRCIGRVIRVEPDGQPDGRTAVAAQIERFETILAEA